MTASAFCDCNAPAVQKLAAQKEMNRQRQARHAEKKRQQKQQNPNVSAADRAEARCAARWKAFTAQEERNAAKPDYVTEDDPRTSVKPSIQYDLLDPVKRTIVQMNEPTREAFAIWFREIHHGEIAF
jgi:hypothetical protein